MRVKHYNYPGRFFVAQLGGGGTRTGSTDGKTSHGAGINLGKKILGLDFRSCNGFIALWSSKCEIFQVVDQPKGDDPAGSPRNFGGVWSDGWC